MKTTVIFMSGLRIFGILISALELLYAPLQAKHIAGGDFTYRRLSGNQFEITLKLYRDCSDFVPFDNSILVGVFDKGNNNLIASYTIALTDTGVLSLTGTSCLTPPAGVCMDKCTYVDTITLANNPNGYYVSWERCCRNNAISNLTRPGDTGIAYYMEIPDPAIYNNSPNFSQDPFPFMCIGQNFDFDFSAFDVDGDQLTYSLETPLAGDLGYPVKSTISPVWTTPTPGPYQAAQWLPGYSVNNLTGSASPLTLNSSTGLMQVKADRIGYYAMAVVVREYRNGVLIGLIRREIEFTVINCNTNAAPQITYQNVTSSQSGLVFTLYEQDTLCFTIKVTDSDSIKLTYSGDIFPGSGITPPFATTSGATGNGIATSSFCWYTSCAHGRTLPYRVVFTAVDNGCPQPFTSIDSLSIFVLPMPQIPAPLLLCMNTSITGQIQITFSDTFSMKRFISRYEIYRSKNGGPFTNIGTINDTSINHFTDLNANDLDHNNYCYYVKPYNKCNEPGLISDTICSDDQKTFAAPVLLSCNVEGSDIVLELNNVADNAFSVFHIEKRENNPAYPYQDYETQQGFGQPQWTDFTQLVNEKSYCYKISKTNKCNITSPKSNESCSILLTGTSIPLQHVLEWTPYTEWTQGVSRYVVYRKPQNSNSYSAIAQLASNILTYTDDNIPQEYGIYNYYISAVNDSINASSRSNEITLIQTPTIYTPNAFTPNGDGLNETWSPFSSFVKTYHLKVFNRWGNLIFETDKTSLTWDGNYNGNPAPLGVYFYVVSYQSFIDNRVEYKRGSITLIR
jgi:gliding motility-associated-like protein